MRGHIAKKDNRCYAVVYEGIDPATGKLRHRWHTAGETRKGAEKVLGDLVKRMHDGDYRATGQDHAQRLPPRTMAAVETHQGEALHRQCV